MLTFLWQKAYAVDWWIAGPILALFVILFLAQVFTIGSEKQIDMFPEDQQGN